MSATFASTRAVSESPRRSSSKPAGPAQDDWPSVAPATIAARAAQPVPPAPARARVAGRAVVLDVETSSRRQLCGELAACSWDVTIVEDIDGLLAAIRVGQDAPGPDLVVAEYRLAGKCVLDLLDAVPRELWPRLVIVTSYGSVASAVRAIKLGVGGYLVKPASGVHVLRAAGHEAVTSEETPASYLSLDRAIWEVLNEAVEQAGTVSGAARRLGLHARSLRRMLAKYPPAR